MNEKKKFYEKEIALSHQIKRDINTESFLRKSENTDRTTNINNRLTNYGNYTAGRGFGNLKDNNFMRIGENSRNDKKIFTEKLESNTNFRFDYLFDDKKQKAFTNNFLKINENTRRQNINSDSIFNHQKFEFDEKKRIEKEYYKSISLHGNFNKKNTSVTKNNDIAKNTSATRSISVTKNNNIAKNTSVIKNGNKKPKVKKKIINKNQDNKKFRFTY